MIGEPGEETLGIRSGSFTIHLRHLDKLIHRVHSLHCWANLDLSMLSIGKDAVSMGVITVPIGLGWMCCCRQPTRRLSRRVFCSIVPPEPTHQQLQVPVTSLA